MLDASLEDAVATFDAFNEAVHAVAAAGDIGPLQCLDEGGFNYFGLP